MDKHPIPRALRLLLPAFFLAGCMVHSVHDASYVSKSLREKTGHELRLSPEKGPVTLPDGVSLDDGLTGGEAVAVALWNNAQFQADISELGFARADLIEAGLLRNPVLSLLFPLGPKQLEATLNLPIDFFWQRPRRILAAKRNVERIAEGLVQHGLNLSRDVLVAYTDLVLARQKEAILADEAEIQRETADIASVRLQAGDISGLEETAIRMEAARSREASIRSVRDARVAEEELKNLMGIGLEETELRLSPLPFFGESVQNPAGWLEMAFAARPDLRAAEIAIEEAGARLGWERSKILNLTAMLDANGEGKEGFEMGPGLQLELPLFNWNNGRIAKALAELDRASKQYTAVRQRIARDVNEARVKYFAALKALKILRDEITPSAEEAAANADKAYSAGEISYLELLEFRRGLLSSKLRQAEAAAELRRAEADLENSIGLKLDGILDD